MPAKIKMFLTNGNKPPIFYPPQQKSVKDLIPKAPSALNTSMISRIHNVKPGCGSCGR